MDAEREPVAIESIEVDGSDPLGCARAMLVVVVFWAALGTLIWLCCR